MHAHDYATWSPAVWEIIKSEEEYNRKWRAITDYLIQARIKSIRSQKTCTAVEEEG